MHGPLEHTLKVNVSPKSVEVPGTESSKTQLVVTSRLGRRNIVVEQLQASSPKLQEPEHVAKAGARKSSCWPIPPAEKVTDSAAAHGSAQFPEPRVTAAA